MDKFTELDDSEAQRIFNNWDLDGDGLLSIQGDIKKVLKLDSNFCLSFFRLLDANKDGRVDIEDLKEIVKILRNGDIYAKLGLLFRLFGVGDEGSLTFQQFKKFLRVNDNSIYEILGFIRNGEVVENKRLRISDLRNIFTESESGEKSIHSFCSALLSILHRSAQSRHEDTDLNMGASSHKQFVVLAILQFICFAITFIYYANNDYSLLVCIAKGFAVNIYIVTVFAFLTMSHSLKEHLYYIKCIPSSIPMHINAQLHSYLGFCLVVHSIGHSIAQIANISITKGISYTVDAPAIISGSSWSRSTSGDGITGYILLITILVIMFTSLMRRMNSFMYTVFRRFHWLYVLWVLLMVFHVPGLWYAAVVGIVIFFLDALYKFVMCTTASTLRQSRNRNNVSYISVRREPSQPRPIPGSYYRLMIPAVSPLEWHPFSLASSCASNHLTFMMDSVGDWTRAVHKLIEDPKRRDSARVYVQGPYSSTTQFAMKDFDDSQPIMIVASGVGITPFLSVMATKVTEVFKEPVEKVADQFHCCFRRC